MMNEISSGLDVSDEDPSRELLIDLVKKANHIMLFTQNTMMSSFDMWPRAIKIYLTIALLYVIWIRNNNALIVEDEKEDLKE